MPERSDAYQLPSWPKTLIDRPLWNDTMADLDARLKAREALEASFESLKAQGIQASLDYIQVNVAPQLANLKTSIDLAQEQIDQIIIGGKAPDTLRFGGQLPAYYATAQNLTQGLDSKVPNARKVNGKELSGDIDLNKSDVGLDKVNNTADADIGSQQIELSPGFARKSVAVDIPGISGKIIGSTPNSYTGIVLWFDAGANLAARSGGITQKSGTYDISHLSLVRGDARAEFDPSSPRSKAIDLILCQRRYQRLTGSFLGGLGASGANVRRFNIGLPTYMRVPPSIFVGSQSGGEAVVWEDVTPNSVRGYVNMNNNTSEVSIADLRFESEL